MLTDIIMHFYGIPPLSIICRKHTGEFVASIPTSTADSSSSSSTVPATIVVPFIRRSLMLRVTLGRTVPLPVFFPLVTPDPGIMPA